MKSKSHIVKEKDLSGANLVDYLRSAISDGTAGLTDVPMLVRQIIENDSWRERFVNQTKDIVVFNSFIEFVHTAPPEGLGTTMKTLIKLCGEFPDVIDLIDTTNHAKTTKAVRTKNCELNRQKGNSKSDNVTHDDLPYSIIKNGSTSKESRGNSTIYALRRLREFRPDIHARVLKKEISVNKAMIEAGLRKNSPQISSNIETVASVLKEKFNQMQIEKLIELLKQKL